MRNIYLTPLDSINEMIRTIPVDSEEETILHLAPGTYYEKVVINRPHLCLTGQSPENTIICFDDYANKKMPDGSSYGTFRSWTMLLDASFVTLENLTISNTSRPRKEVGQAIALYADGDQLHIRNCRLLSLQDTLFTGPLPPTERKPGGFVGPKEFAPRINGRQYYENCYICGNVDFIFGSASAWFTNCHIEAISDSEDCPAYLTAASTPEGQAIGYVFDRCRLTGKGFKPGSVYLGRPWRDFARTVFLNCYMDESIHPAGFHDWNRPEAHQTVLYGEYYCYGPGASRTDRVPFCRELSEEEAAGYDLQLLPHLPDRYFPE